MRIAATLSVALVLVTGCSNNESKPTPTPARVDVHARQPAPGSFEVDATHSTVLFKATHAGAGYVYGWFKDVSGAFTIDADPAKSHVELSVKVASVDTRDDERNANIAGPDFLNAKQFPELTFKSTRVDATATGWHIAGDLTIHGATKSVAFDAVLVGDAKGPQGRRLVGVEARFTITRGDFGVLFMPEMVGPDLELIVALEGAAV
jgi:polyisoprenoid-binding protein YceI